jgi:hypothetical protein
MAINFTWGYWKEEWPNGQFRCVLVEASPASDGMIRATGLYRATPGEVFEDLDTYADQIANRTAVTTDGNGALLIRKEFAELLGTLPNVLQEVADRLGLLADRNARRLAG